MNTNYYQKQRPKYQNHEMDKEYHQQGLRKGIDNARQIIGENKTKKIDIKKLIQKKEARENREKTNEELKKQFKFQKYFEKTSHKSIQKCILCGFVIFAIDSDKRQSIKIDHLSQKHSQIQQVTNKVQRPDSKNDEYIHIASSLVRYANKKDNKQIMEYVLGQYLPQPFTPYIEKLQVPKHIQKWKQAVQNLFELYQP